jgi:CRAL/TRIO domain
VIYIPGMRFCRRSRLTGEDSLFHCTSIGTHISIVEYVTMTDHFFSASQKSNDEPMRFASQSPSSIMLCGFRRLRMLWYRASLLILVLSLLSEAGNHLKISKPVVCLLHSVWKWQRRHTPNHGLLTKQTILQRGGGSRESFLPTNGTLHPHHYGYNNRQFDATSSFANHPRVDRSVRPPSPPAPPNELPLRFLRAGKNDPVLGLQRYEATLAWRKRERVDTILRESFPQFPVIKQFYPHFYHLSGRAGEPCFYEQPAKTNLRALREHGIQLDQLLRHYIMITEFQWQYIERNDTARSIYIIDLDGIRMRDFFGETIDFVKKAAAISAQHYPERAGCVFIVNVPSWFKLIWQVVRPIIDESTLKKIYILRGQNEIRQNLLQRIPMEHIPPEYGGTSVPLGYSPQEQELARLVQHNNALASQRRAACNGCRSNVDAKRWPCHFCRWTPARSY